MSVPEKTSPPFEGLGPERDKDEELVRLAIIGDLHFMYDAAIERDDFDTETTELMEAGSSSDFMDSPDFIINHPEDDVVPAPYAHLFWKPVHKYEPLAVEGYEVAAINVRVPKIESLSPDFKPPVPMKYWRDIFIEVTTHEGPMMRYLLNQGGIKAYCESESINDLGNRQKPGSADFFMVTLEDWRAPILDANQLRELFRQSIMGRHDND